MEGVCLISMNFNDLDQDRLVDFLINKNVNLILDEGDYGPNLDIRKLIEKLLESTEFRLHELWMNNVQYPDDLAEDMADALCQLECVGMGPYFRLKSETRKRLLENILSRPTKTLRLYMNRNINWSTLIGPDNLKTMVDKMEEVELRGTFTVEQLEAARSCPGVNVSSDTYFKGASSEIFSFNREATHFSNSGEWGFTP